MPAPRATRPSAVGWLLAAVLVVAISTVAVSFLPSLDVAYRSPAAHVAIETAGVIVAFVAAAVCSVRVGRRGALGDVLLFAALLLLATVNAAFSLAPSLAGASNVPFATWAAATGRLVAAGVFLAAASTGDRLLRAPAAARRIALASVVGCTAVIGVTAAALHDALPLGVRTLAEASGVVLRGDPFIEGSQLLSAAMFAGAGCLFLRRRFVSDAGARALLPAAMMLAAGARVNYSLVPTLYTNYVHLGDVLRLGFYLAILAAVLADILSYERRLSEAAVLRERQRLARELHDGLAQELAYISAQAQQLSGERAAERGRAIARSADRALRESRYAISALMEPPEGSVDAMLRQAALDAVRGRATVEVDVHGDAKVAPEAREALRRIVAEAARNAVRHGGASRIDVTLWCPGELMLCVSDNGRGFNPQADVKPGSYGLVTMRERAEALGGLLEIRSAPGGGATVEVRLP
jgi:signal transduction histidine kinase